MTRWQHDVVLRAVEDQPEPIGSLAAAYPGSAAAVADPTWISDWFTTEIHRHVSGKAKPLPTLIASAADKTVVDPLSRKPATSKVRLAAIQAQWFRGFRTANAPIHLAEDLVVVEGRNSSGKTSLSEAIEWLITGELSRRSSGNPKELANCIANHFRPPSEETWVQCDLLVDGKPTTLRRTLLDDYTEAAGSRPASTLAQDGKSLSQDQSDHLLSKVFAGVHPILMQHTLREFVYNTPADRRKYFERLLQIDELTGLIERAVVGEARLKDYPCPTAPRGRASIDALAAACQAASSKKTVKEINRLGLEAKSDLAEHLLSLAVTEFGNPHETLPSARQHLKSQLAEARQRQFPAIAQLRIAASASIPDAQALESAAHEVVRTADSRVSALEAANAVNAADRIVAATIQELATLGIITLPGDTDQHCPLCEDPRSTLTAARLSALSGLQPLLDVLADAERVGEAATQQFVTERASIGRRIGSFRLELTDDVESTVTEIAPQLQPAAIRTIQSARALNTVVDEALRQIKDVSHEQVRNTPEAVRLIIASVEREVEAHLENLNVLEAGLGSDAADEPTYAAKQAWVALAENITETADQLAWEWGRRQAQDTLASIREALIALRTAVIEGARQTFTSSMNAVWSLLRADPNGKFSQIAVPEPRGRGYKLEFEVKAVLNDGTRDVEVDALRVFSESQVNVVGIAAFVTRAKALNQTMLVFDDPVQSMDEEHLKSLASRLIPAMIEEGRQIIVLTHSESFARDVSHYHWDRDSYATLATTYSRKRGCVVDEGNRRVAERLKAAEKLRQDGKLKEAWLRIRLAVERLYTVAMRAANPSFNPDSWRNATAEDMWNQGAATAILSKVADAEPRLKEILGWSAKSAHDNSPVGTTDLMHSIEYLRSLLGPLRVGSG